MLWNPKNLPNSHQPHPEGARPKVTLPWVSTRGTSALLIPLTIALGLLTRPLKHYADALGAALGNALYGVLIFLLIALAFPRLKSLPTLLLATAICWAIEISQAFHAPGLDAFRSTLVGALTIGGTFHIHDLWCYLAGTGAAFLVERSRLSSHPPRSQTCQPNPSASRLSPPSPSLASERGGD